MIDANSSVIPGGSERRGMGRIVPELAAYLYCTKQEHLPCSSYAGLNPVVHGSGGNWSVYFGEATPNDHRRSHAVLH